MSIAAFEEVEVGVDASLDLSQDGRQIGGGLSVEIASNELLPGALDIAEA
jgi:hypothetical protein